MEKRPVPTKPVAGPPRKPKPKVPEDQGDTLVGSADSPPPSKSGQVQAQTEEFTLNAQGDGAGGFLAEEGLATEVGDAEAASKTKGSLGTTEAFTQSPAPPAHKGKRAPTSLARTEHFDQNQAPPPPRKAPAAGAKAAQAQSAASGQQKATTLGDYKLVKKLGQGGMGAVYKAHQVSLDREVAVKVLSKELAGKPAFVQRFLREARVMAKLDHPNILRCFDVGEMQGYHFLAMEFIDGGSIEGWLKKLGKFSIGDSLHIILACAHALQHAHELNMVHRDIKPDNILLTKKGLIKVADLGLAKAQDDDMSLTKTGTGAGTPLFMAPEQARDVKRVDGRCDIYALGCMLYNFLTGEVPFKGETLVELITAKEKGKFKPVRDFNDEVPERLDLIIGKLIATKPEHRFQTCAELILELDNMGLDNKHLSFLEPPEGTGTRPGTPPPPPKKIAVPGVNKSAKTPAAPSKGNGPGKEESGNFWYAAFTSPAGKMITKKLTSDQLLTLIKSKSFNPETQVSRTLKGGYRALGSYKEFSNLFKANEVKDKADVKGQKYRSLYQQIEKDDERRRRWKWLRNLFSRTGGFFGLILWLVLIAVILGGVVFGVRWALIQFGVEVPF